MNERNDVAFLRTDRVISWVEPRRSACEAKKWHMGLNMYHAHPFLQSTTRIPSDAITSSAHTRDWRRWDPYPVVSTPRTSRAAEPFTSLSASLGICRVVRLAFAELLSIDEWNDFECTFDLSSCLISTLESSTTSTQMQMTLG